MPAFPGAQGEPPGGAQAGRRRERAHRHVGHCGREAAGAGAGGGGRAAGVFAWGGWTLSGGCGCGGCGVR